MHQKVTVVIPCYNEESRLDRTAFLIFVKEQSDVSLLFVDDGSTDATFELLTELQQSFPERISCLRLPGNVGKAEAVRQGVLHCVDDGFDLIGYWDADLATPLEEIIRFVHYLPRDSKRKLICGARIKKLGAEIDRNWYRHYPGRVIATLISFTLKLPIYDTQCGAKLFTRKIGLQLFSTPFCSTWLFDVEILARIISKYGNKRTREIVCELPLRRWKDVGKSHVNPAYIFKIPIELAKIYRKWLKGL